MKDQRMEGKGRKGEVKERSIDYSILTLNKRGEEREGRK